MRVSRLMFWVSASLLTVLLLSACGIIGCGFKGPSTAGKNIPCGRTKVKVSSNGVDKPAIYVCDNDVVSWNPDRGVTFTVHFDPTNCPFSPCPDISDSNPRKVVNQPIELTVYKYTIWITANGVTNKIDPHVVGGGGN